MISQGGYRLAGVASSLLAAVLCSPAAPATGAPLFEDEQPLELTLELPLKSLLRERKDRPEVEAVAIVTGPGGQSRRVDVKVATRGHNRLDKCDFPPLSLNFKRSQVDGTVFADQDKLKLSTLCRSKSDYEDFLELERLAYLLYQQATDVSLRARAASMRYVDTDRGGEVVAAPAFFLEHFDSLAKRSDRVVLDVPTVPLADLDPAQLALIGLFEYLIGNTDFAATSAAAGRECCHNIVPLVRPGTTAPVVPFPYDFDSSGFVDASYAVPDARLKTRSVRDRVYRGYCISNPHLEAARAGLNRARPAMESVIQGGRLSAKAQRKALDYLASGFEDLNDARDWRRKIVDQCRGE